MNRWLTSLETRCAMRKLGVDRPFSSSFGFSDRPENLRYNFHRHRQHQLIFPAFGLLFIETKSNFYIASPQIGLWIPAGVRHATTTLSAQTLAVFLSPTEFCGISESPATICVTPLLLEAMRHSVDRQDHACEYSSALFRVIHGLAAENLMADSWPTLPVSSSESLKRTIDAVLSQLSSISVQQLAAMTGQSERSMRRRFLKEIGMGPELFIQRARLIRAMQLLIGNQEQSITEIGLEAGYSNHSAFTSAFRKMTGLTPSVFRRGGGNPASTR